MVDFPTPDTPRSATVLVSCDKAEIGPLENFVHMNALHFENRLRRVTTHHPDPAQFCNWDRWVDIPGEEIVYHFNWGWGDAFQFFSSSSL